MEKFSQGKWSGIRIIWGSQKANRELNINFEEMTQESSVAIITFGYVQERFGFFMYVLPRAGLGDLGSHLQKSPWNCKGEVRGQNEWVDKLQQLVFERRKQIPISCEFGGCRVWCNLEVITK